MAIYSLHMSKVSRAAGSSSVAAVSYITSERMHDELYEKTYNGFGRRERVLESHTLLPEGAPAEYADPERLFNSIEMAEKQMNACTAKKVMVALPRELGPELRREAVERFIDEQITRRGYACTYAIHEDREGNNPHAHIVIANRQINPSNGKWEAKRKKEYVLGANGRRVPVIDPATGEQKTDKRNRKQWKRVDVERNPLDLKATLLEMREAWAATCNELLPEGVTIDHRSNETRGIDRIPTKHEGYEARRLEASGIPTEIGDYNREVRRANRLLDELSRQFASVRQLMQQLREKIANAVRGAWRRPDPRDFVPAARRQLESERERRVESLTDDLRMAEQNENSRRSWLRDNTGKDWKRDVLPSLSRVEKALKTVESAGLFGRGKARRELEDVAVTETARLREHAPWLTFDAIPTDREGFNDFMADTKRQGVDHELEPAARRTADLRRQIEKERATPISPQEIEALARRMAEKAGNGPQTSEPEPHRRQEQPKRRMTVSDLRAKLKSDAARRMEDQAEREAEQQLDPFAWMPDDPGRTHGLSR